LPCLRGADAAGLFMWELLAYKDAMHLEIFEVMMQRRVNFLHIKMIVQFARLAIQGDDGGFALKTLGPKLDLFKSHVFETLHFKDLLVDVPPVGIKIFWKCCVHL
jgi:hypothetical protein